MNNFLENSVGLLFELFLLNSNNNLAKVCKVNNLIVIYLFTPPFTLPPDTHSCNNIIAYLVLLSHFTTENARAELGRLFNFTPVGMQRKRKLPTGIKLPNTWTHTFVCLG